MAGSKLERARVETSAAWPEKGRGFLGSRHLVRVDTLWRSLRGKIIAWSFVPTAIILTAVALVTVYAYQRVTEGLVIGRDRDLTHLSASLLSAELGTYTDPLSDEFLSVFDSGMVVFDERGKILAAEPERVEGLGADWARRISFRQMLDSSEPTFSDVIVLGPGGEKVVVVFVPIIGRDGEHVGGIAGVFRLEPAGSAFYETIEHLRRGETDRIYLVDGNGRVIYHSEPAYIGDDFSSQVIVQRVLNGEVGALRTRDPTSRDIVASYAPVPGTSWGLVAEESWSELTKTSRRYAQFLLLLLLLGLGVPAVIVGVGVNRITRPVADLIRGAQKVAGGDFSQRISAPTGDEIEELAEQFNKMAIQLQASYDQLERKVADRTKELAALNTLATVVSRSLDLDEILNDALDQALGIAGMENGQAFLLEEETQQLVLIAHRGVSDELVRYTSRLPLTAGVSGLAAKEGRPVPRLVSEYPESELKALLQGERLQLVISIPLMAKEKTVGAIDLGSRELRSLSSEELSLLAAIGHQIGVAVENARLYEQAQQFAVVKERNRLARDLHDSVMQSLYGLTMYAEAAARQLASGQMGMTTDHLREIRGTAEDALREMRVLIFELRPPVLDRDGLAAALRARLESVEGQVGIQTALETDFDGRLSPEIEVGLYRVAQEALNNALKHAEATSATVRLHQDGRYVVLEILDNGVGFDPVIAREQGGFGLRGMEERIARLGGRLTVHSAPGEGTRIRAEV